MRQIWSRLNDLHNSTVGAARRVCDRVAGMIATCLRRSWGSVQFSSDGSVRHGNDHQDGENQQERDDSQKGCDKLNNQPFWKFGLATMTDRQIGSGSGRLCGQSWS